MNIGEPVDSFLEIRNAQNLTQNQPGVVKTEGLIEIADQQILPGN
jgi:hypothetical protein